MPRSQAKSSLLADVQRRPGLACHGPVCACVRVRAARMSEVFSQNWDVLAGAAASPLTTGTKTAPAAATIADAHSPQGFSASSMPADPHPGRNAWAQSQRPDLPITPADQAALTQVSGLSPSSGAKDSSSSSSGGGGGGSDGAVAEAAPSSPPFSGSAPATGLALPCVGSTGSSDPIHGSAPEKVRGGGGREDKGSLLKTL